MSAAQRLDVAASAAGSRRAWPRASPRRSSSRAALDRSTFRPAERLQRLVVQLARPAVALGLGRRHASGGGVGLHRLARSPPRSPPVPRRPRSSCSSSRVKVAVAVDAVEGGEHAEALAAVDERDEQRRRGMRRARAARAGSAARAPRRRCAGCGLRRAPGRRSSRPAAGAPACVDLHVARAGGDHELVALAQHDEHVVGLHQRPPALDDQLEDAIELGLRRRRRGRSPPWPRSPRTARSSSSRRAATSR